MKAAAYLLLSLCCVLHAPLLRAHGSVTDEGDLCVIRIGFYTAHFKVFQPQRSGEREYCEDLPGTGESVFVMDYVHQGLREVPLEFRIIRDATGLGRFARLEDVLALGDLDAFTVFHQPPSIEPDVFTVLYEFTDEAAYLGIVSARNPETGELYQAVFPFSVGFQGWGLLPLFLLLAVVAQAAYWLSSRGIRWLRGRSRLKQEHMKAMGLLPLLLLMGAGATGQSWISESGNMRASYASEVAPIPLNNIHAWTVHLETIDGEPVENAQLTVSGGMPAHNHGLPTAPAVTAYLGNGNYRVEGLRFHMQGRWVLRLVVQHHGSSDTINIPLTL